MLLNVLGCRLTYKGQAETSIPKHGSVLLYVHRNQKTESPRRPPRLSHSSWAMNFFYHWWRKGYVCPYTSTCTLPKTLPENLFSIHFTVLDKVSSKAETTSVDEENNGGSKGKRYSIDLSIAKIAPAKREGKKFMQISLHFCFVLIPTETQINKHFWENLWNRFAHWRTRANKHVYTRPS